MSTPPPIPARAMTSHAAVPGWWQRNWKWALVVSVVGVVLALACIAVFSVRALLRNSDVHADAVARGRAHPRVIAALGTPVEPGFMPMGNISIATGGGGHAELRIPLQGPRGDGRLVAVAERQDRRWRYETLTFESVDAREEFRLVEPGAPIRTRPPVRQ